MHATAPYELHTGSSPAVENDFSYLRAKQHVQVGALHRWPEIGSRHRHALVAVADQQIGQAAAAIALHGFGVDIVDMWNAQCVCGLNQRLHQWDRVLWQMYAQEPVLTSPCSVRGPMPVFHVAID